MTMISLKVSPEMLERIDAEAELCGMTRTALLLKPWSEEPVRGQPAWDTRDYSQMRYAGINRTSRPAHAVDCKCWTCRPPKADA